MGEAERIKEVYRKRDLNGKSREYTKFNPSALFIFQQREKAIIQALKSNGMIYLADKKILDVGCGTGDILRQFINYGAKPEHLHGIDLIPERIKIAKKLSPNIDFHYGNAENLPFKKQYFDIVLQFTMFTSILNIEMKRKIAEEILASLNQNGVILWYDYFISKPSNPDVHGVKKREIKSLFPDCIFNFKKITLAPPITRVLAPYSFLSCYLLEKIPFLCTHFLTVIKKH